MANKYSSSLVEPLEYGIYVSLTLVWLSGLPTCYRYFAKKKTENASVLWFVVGLVLSNIYLHYGIFFNDPLILATSILGCFVQGLYVLTFIVCSPKRRNAIIQLIIALILIVAFEFTYWSIWIHRMKPDADSWLLFQDLIVCFSLLFYASPLNELVHAVLTGNTGTVPFLTILFSFTTSYIKFTHRYAVDGFQFINLQLANMTSIILTGFQLIVFAGILLKHMLNRGTSPSLSSCCKDCTKKSITKTFLGRATPKLPLSAYVKKAVQAHATKNAENSVKSSSVKLEKKVKKFYVL